MQEPNVNPNKEIAYIVASLKDNQFITEPKSNVFDYNYDLADQFKTFVEIIQKKEPSFDLPILFIFPGGQLETILNNSLKHRLITRVGKDKFVDYNNQLIPLENMIDIYLNGEHQYLVKVLGPLKGIVEFRKDNTPLYPSAMQALKEKGYNLKQIDL